MFVYSLLIVTLLGLAVGSFLNVLILRAISGKSLTGRSECVHCHHVLAVWDLIPIISFITLKGRCRYCHEKISWQYPLVEGFCLGIFIATFLLVSVLFNQSLNLHSLFLLTIYFFGSAVLLAVFVTDLRFGLIPNRIIIPGILGLLFLKLVYLGFLGVSSYFTLLKDPAGLGRYLLPPYSGYLFTILSRQSLTVFYDLIAGLGIGLAFYLLVLFTKGRAMGGGDIKLGFFIGLLNGWPLSLVTLMLSFTSGALFGIGLLIVKQKKFGQTIPFGPFLVFGSLVTLFWGQRLFEMYLNLLG